MTRRSNPVVEIRFPSTPPIGTVIVRACGAKWRLVRIDDDEFSGRPLLWERDQDGYRWATPAVALDLKRGLRGLQKSGGITVGGADEDRRTDGAPY